MKIAVVGCGAVGSYYGAKLHRSGLDTHFLLRSDLHAVQQHGVSVRSPAGDFTVHPHCAATPEEVGVADLVLIGLKTTANHQFERLLPPLISPATAIVTLQNGLGNEEALARLFPAEQILGGLCFVCLNRIEPGVIHHMDHGLVVLGEFVGRPRPRTHEIAARFLNAGVPCKVSENLARTHWEKLVWNIPFNGLGVAATAGWEVFRDALNHPGPAPASIQAAREQSCLATDRLLADGRWTSVLRELMLEVIRAANALGFQISEDLAEKQIERTRTMGAYRASTLIDFEQGRPLELEGLFLEPLRRAEAAGLDLPHLEALVKILRALDPGGA